MELIFPSTGLAPDRRTVIYTELIKGQIEHEHPNDVSFSIDGGPVKEFHFAAKYNDVSRLKATFLITGMRAQKGDVPKYQIVPLATGLLDKEESAVIVQGCIGYSFNMNSDHRTVTCEFIIHSIHESIDDARIHLFEKVLTGEEDNIEGVG